MIINISKINLSGCSGGGGGDSKVISTKDFSITANGTTNITMDEGVDGISAGTITTNVQPTLTSATFTANTTYTPVGADGFSSVTVNVPQIGEDRLPALLCGYDGYGVTALTESDFSSFPMSNPNLSQYNIAFKDGLRSITFPWWINMTSNNSCAYCNNLETVNLDRFTELGNNSFYNDYKLSSVGGLMNVQKFGSTSFNGCKLSGHIDIMPDSNDAFSNVYNVFHGNNDITGVTVHDSLNVIGPSYTGTFLGNITNLEVLDLTHNVVVPTLTSQGVNNFTSSTKNFEIRVPQILYDEWTGTTNWSTIASHIVSCPNPHSNNTLRYTTSDGQPITSWTVTSTTGWNGIYVSDNYDAVTGGSITMYGMTRFPYISAAADKRRLVTLEMPDSILRITQSSLQDCTGLTSLKLSENLRYNGGSVFYNLNNVQSLTFGADYVGMFHLRSMPSLTDVTLKCVIPPHTTGNYAFSGLRENGTFHVPAQSVSVYENWIQRLVNEAAGNEALLTWTVTAISS